MEVVSVATGCGWGPRQASFIAVSILVQASNGLRCKNPQGAWFEMVANVCCTFELRCYSLAKKHRCALRLESADVW